jgi:hypothetical protein
MSQKLPDEYHIIVDEIMPDVMGRFVSKAGDYGDAWKLLGAKGQFSDINRKFWKLHNSIWLDKELLGEQPDECAEDIIGHCLLLLYILREESTPERPDFSSPERPVLPPLPASEPARVGEDAARCPTTVERSLGLRRCELFRGHKGLHLTDIGTVNQYQWGLRVK